MARSLASGMATAMVFLGPFVLSISERLSQELLCPRDEILEQEEMFN